MSTIITDKLKQIENAKRDDKAVYSAPSTEASHSKRKREPIFQTNDDRYSANSKVDERCSCEGYHIAKLWTAKLRKLKCEQRMYAEKAIYDVLFEAQLGNLHKSSVKINGLSSQAQWTPSTISNSSHYCSYASKSNNSSPQYRSYHIFEASTPTECADGLSSEVMITESFPNENGLLSSESQLQEQEDLTSNNSVKTRRGHKRGRNKTFIIAATPETVKVLPSSPPCWCQSNTSIVETAIDGDTFTNSGTHNKDCILTQLRRYIRDCYNRLRLYPRPYR